MPDPLCSMLVNKFTLTFLEIMSVGKINLELTFCYLDVLYRLLYI